MCFKRLSLFPSLGSGTIGTLNIKKTCPPPDSSPLAVNIRKSVLSARRLSIPPAGAKVSSGRSSLWYLCERDKEKGAKGE